MAKGVSSVNKQSLENAVSLARIEATINGFVSRFERHETQDITISARIDARLESIERRSEERNRETDAAIERRASALAETVDKQFKALSDQIGEITRKQSFFSGGRAMASAWITAAIGIALGLINLLRH